MRRQALGITLEEDCVFSVRSATVGGHESLDRIPGQALLGAAASSLYSSLDRREAFVAFHSGRLRFGDGLPFDGIAQGFPVPLAWHHAKTDKAEANGRLMKEKVYNFLHQDKIVSRGQREEQPKQLRMGYVFTDGRIIKPARSLRMKTAIEPGEGRAAEGQLFGYESLVRGQYFATVIEAEENLDNELFKKVIGALRGDLLLGRSRSAEYGRAHAEAVELSFPAPGPVDDKCLTLWLLSDLAVADDHGRPTLEPQPEFLGLGGGDIIWEKTFLRSRRYSPWNAARHGYDRERLVLNAGGVITLKLSHPPTPEMLRLLMCGVGLYREAGLGRVWANPPLLTDSQPQFKPGDEKPLLQCAVPAQPNHPLVGWLKDQAGGWKTPLDDRAEHLVRQYRKQVETARRLVGVPRDVDFGPSKSQWGRILEAARRHSGQALFDILFNSAAVIVKPTGEGWSIEVVAKVGKYQSLAKWLEEALPVEGESREYAYLVRQVAHRIRGGNRKRGGGKS